MLLSNGCSTTAYAQSATTPQIIQQPTQQPLQRFDYDANTVTSLDEIKECVFKVNIHERYKVEGFEKEYTLDGHGSAVAFTKDGTSTYVLTNDHVASPMSKEEFLDEFRFELMLDALPDQKVPSAEDLKFSVAENKSTLIMGKASLPLEVLVANKKEDLVLGRVPSTALPLCEQIGDSSHLRVGNVLYISGFGGDEYKMSRGIYSGPSSEGFEDSSSYLIGDPTIIGGYSGGGTFALKEGKPVLVGINRLRLEGFYSGFIGTSLIGEWLAKTPYAKLWLK